jgi:UDP-N-acetylmuramoyl-L-alanyl-D-glutamate--2,6-diaminopimelate ligase
MIAALLGTLARPVASVTTLGSFLDQTPLEGSSHYEGFLTTMRGALDAGGRYAALELTSEALALGFARSWPCSVGVFTNLSLDHSDAHASPEHYLAAKAQLFMALPLNGRAVLNGCDPNAQLIAEVIPHGVEVIRYAVPSRGSPWARADLVADSIVVGPEGTCFRIEASQRFADLPSSWSIRAIGEIFVENALAALAAALALGVPAGAAQQVLSALAPPPGRFEIVRRRPFVVVDYAHTPDALQRTLITARTLSTGKVTVVLGAGGHRDKAKRPLLGAAATVADRVVLTSDNPRDENPSTIVDQIAAGIGHGPIVIREIERRRAIHLALKDADANDWVVIAGKGHEQHQETHGIKLPFSDTEIVRESSLY